jgi:hypothetical protein
VVGDVGLEEDAVLGAASEAAVSMIVRSELTAFETTVPEQRVQAWAVVVLFAARTVAAYLPSSSNQSRCVLEGWRTYCRSSR